MRGRSILKSHLVEIGDRASMDPTVELTGVKRVESPLGDESLEIGEFQLGEVPRLSGHGYLSRFLEDASSRL
jgi:hypothetical protein